MSPSPKRERTSSAYCGVIARFAPPQMMMQFCPVASTWITAWPVGASQTASAETSAPSAASASFSQRPSAPISPACATRAPARARAVLWLKPLPPEKTA